MGRWGREQNREIKEDKEEGIVGMDKGKARESSMGEIEIEIEIERLRY